MGFLGSLGLNIGHSGATSSSSQNSSADNSNRQATTAQSGTALQGNTISGTVVNNDASIVSMGIENNNIAASVLNHLSDITGATIGKLSDAVKQTSNDSLQSAITTNAAQAQTNDAFKSIFKNLSDNIQIVVAVAAVGLGAWYFLKGKK